MRILMALVCCSLLAIGCGAPDDLVMSGDGLFGKDAKNAKDAKTSHPGHKCKKKPSKQANPKACYYGCLKKGLSAAKCKAACTPSPAKKKIQPGCKAYQDCKICWDSTGKIVKKYCPQKQPSTDPKACYYGCLKKGIDATKCKAICTTPEPKQDETTICYNACLKKGIDAAKCKAICTKQAPPIQCKEYKTADGLLCKACTDGKKYCEKSQAPVQCKEYKTADGLLCKACMDSAGNVKKYCEKPQSSVQCKEYQRADGTYCKTCTDGKTYCQ